MIGRFAARTFAECPISIIRRPAFSKIRVCWTQPLANAGTDRIELEEAFRFLLSRQS